VLVVFGTFVVMLVLLVAVAVDVVGGRRHHRDDCRRVADMVAGWATSGRVTGRNPPVPEHGVAPAMAGW